jgi:hypothetical protein
MPGFFIPVRMIDRFELCDPFPDSGEPLTRLIATVFVTFAIVAVGFVAAFERDALSRLISILRSWLRTCWHPLDSQDCGLQPLARRPRAWSSC